MNRQWKPGDVAMVRNRWDVWNLAVCSVEPGGFVWRFGVTNATEPIDMEARPLLVIDPEDREQVERLVNAFYAAQPEDPTARVNLRDHMQAALRSLLTPPKPPEPQGLGAVVRDAEGATWVRTHATGYPWHANLDPTDRNCTAVRKYADVDAVEVLSEDVQP